MDNFLLDQKNEEPKKVEVNISKSVLQNRFSALKPIKEQTKELSTVSADSPFESKIQTYKINTPKGSQLHATSSENEAMKTKISNTGI